MTTLLGLRKLLIICLISTKSFSADTFLFEFNKLLHQHELDKKIIYSLKHKLDINQELRVILLTIENDHQDIIHDFIKSSISNNINNIRILERSVSSVQHRELSFQLSDMVDSKTRVKIGNLLGGNAIMIGSVEYQKGYKGIMEEIPKSFMLIVRLVDIESGLIVWAEKFGVGEESSLSLFEWLIYSIFPLWLILIFIVQLIKKIKQEY